MKLSDLKLFLKNNNSLTIVQPNNEAIPSHFHITEIGMVTKHFIDCGGSMHLNKIALFQTWIAEDINHRLKPEKLLQIMEIFEARISNEDLEIEIEYQLETIGKYGLSIIGNKLQLVALNTDCLAKELCGVPEISSNLATNESCKPNSGCC